MPALVKCDAVTKTEERRRIVIMKDGKDCDWCGQERNRLFEFSTQTAGGQAYPHRGAFCSKRCHDSWHHIGRFKG